jgi:sortase B
MPRILPEQTLTERVFMNSVSTLNTGQMNTTYRDPLPARLARGLIRIISELVTLSVITFFLLMFLYASWSIYDAQRIFSGADTTVYETYKPESDVDDSPTFQELVAINPDVLGWITVYGTGIDYPLVQGETNDSYINTSVEKKFSLSGSIFLDSANEPDFSDFNTIIHGHHMEKHEMFGDLDLFREKAFFDSHEYGNIYYGGKNHGLQFFAIIDGDAYNSKLYNPKVEDSRRQEYLNYLEEQAHFTRDIGVTPEDHIVLLNTCASGASNARYLLMGKICDETFADPFPKEEKAVVERIVQGTNLPFLKTLPAWWIYVFGAFIVLTIGLIGAGIFKLLHRTKPAADTSAVPEEIEEIQVLDLTDEGGYDEKE